MKQNFEQLSELFSNVLRIHWALTFDCVFVAAGREPSGFATLIRHSPDGLRRFAKQVDANWP